LENELAPYYEEALRMPGGAKNPHYLTAIGLKKVTQNWEWMINLTPLQLPSIFEKRMLQKRIRILYGPERRSSTTHILGGATMGENSTEGVVDKTIKFFDTRTFILSIAP
jgi:hypothetical protein